MTRRATVALVARREVRERLRSKVFWYSNLFLLAVLVIALVLPVLLRGDDSPPRLGVVPGAATTLGDAAVARAGSDRAPEVAPLADAAAARSAVEDGSIDAALLGGGSVVVREQLDPALGALLDEARRALAVQAALTRAGVAQPEQRAALDPGPLQVATTAPQDEVVFDADVAVGAAAGFLLYGLLITYGQQVAQGVVEEKQSRVVEVLLSTVRPVPLLAGKVLGLGVLGLAQVLLLAAVGLVGAAVTGLVDVTAGTLGTLALLTAWYVLGFLLYATLFALAGSLVSRVEDLQSAALPVIALLLASLFLVQFSFNDPRGTVSLVAGLLPTSAPLAQPLRQSAGVSSAGEVALSVALTLGTIGLLVPLAARVYSRTALVTRGRTRLAEAVGRRAAP